ncbi:MAG: hypothetical protein IJ881_01125, partial [Neisseriaceae bacterium]|nr:hypothetical protein [Neisseriaceae bacterium]
KGIPNDEDLRRQYGEVVADKHYSSFDERRTAALFILQSVWNGRGNSTSITRSYNIDAMTSYIARTQPEYFDSYSVGDSVTNHFLTKNSIFTHKNLREMGLDNNPNLAPYAPELLQATVEIEQQHRVFSQWQNQNSEGGWYNRGAENIIDFKQIPAAVQKDLILMVSDRYLSKRDMFGVYDNPVIAMQHGLAVRSEVQRNLEMLIGQQEKELQQYQKMGLGVSVPQEDAITQQINAYKETLEQVKNAPAVAFVPETLLVVGETKPDWRTGEVQRYNTTEINTATGEITFVNDKNNPNPNPFGDMTEQARQYLSANNNFALAALGVAPKEMPENVKFDLNGLPETEPRLGDEIITLSNVRLPELILNAHLIGDNGHPLERNLPQFNFETPELKEEQEYISKVAKLLSDNELQKVQTLSNQLSSLRDLRQSYFDNNQGELVNDMNKHITLLERQIGNEVLGAYHNPQRLQEHIIDMEFRLIEIKNEQRANWDMRYYQSAAYLEQQYKQINQNLDLRRQALQTLVNAYPHLKDIQENIAASISLDGNALKWKKEIVKDEYGFNQNQYKSNLGDFVIKELREVGAFETRHNGKVFSSKTLKATKEQVEYWYKEQQLRAELPKTPQVKFDMFEQEVSMPTKNVETQPETVYEFNNGCFVIISNNFADNIDKNGNGDFDNEAQLLHKDYPESLATYYYSVEGVDDNSSAIHLFDNLGRKDYDNFRNYEVDLSNPNWQQDLAKEMVSFVVSKEIINGLDKQQPAEIVKISNGADFWREMSVQMETQRIEQNRIEKREQVFNMITASGVMNTAWNGDETHGTESVLDTPFINKSLYYQDGELVYKDANYEHFETPDIFKISKQDFERHSPQAIALAVMKGVEEYKKMYRPEKAPEQSPTKRNDLQHTVNVGLQQYDNMFSPEIQKTHRLDILASQEKHRSHSVSGSQKEQTALQGGINSVKFDDFGVSESVPFAEKIFQSTAENLHKIEQVKQNPDEDPEKNKRMIKMLTGMHDYIERLKDNYHKATNSGDNLLAASYLESVSINQELFDQRFDHWIENSVKHDLNTPKTLTPQEQALKDGKDLSAAEIKVRDSKWELAKQPNNAERKTAYEQAQAELTALKSEIKERVQAAMDKGVPYIARYSEVPQEPFNNAKAPIEFAITPKGELTEVIGTTDTPHNLVPSNAGQGAVLNTEQRSSPQRIAEVLREHYQKSGILSQLDAINAVGGDKVFSEQEIKQTLNRALKDYHPSSIRGALESPRMKDEWLQVVIDKHP